MDVESPHVALSQQRVDTLQSPVARPSPIGSSDHNRADGVIDDDVVSVAYDEIRRSVSPQVAEYIFKPRTGQTPSGSSSPEKAGWSINSLLSIPLAGPELMRLTKKNLSHLRDLAINLWNFGGGKYMDCISHVQEILLARESLSPSEDVSALDEIRARLSMTYFHLGRMAECETLLTDGLREIESLRPGSPEGFEFRISLARLRLVQGQHSLAEGLCAKVILSQRSTLGLNDHYTWKAYKTLSVILKSQNKFDEERRLTTDFYLDVYQTLSEAFLPGLRAALAVCRNYIEVWMTELKLQRLMGDLLICDHPLSISERNKLTLSVVFWESLREDSRLGIVPQVLKDLGKMVGFSVKDIFSPFALLIALRIQPVRHLESASLQQEALQVVKEFKFTKFLVPLWIFVYLDQNHFWTSDFNWNLAEQDFIHSLEDAVIKGGHSPGAPPFSLSTGTGSPGSTLTVDRSHGPAQIDTLNGPKSVVVLSVAAGQGSTPDVSRYTNGLYRQTPMPSAVSSSILISPRSQPTSGAVELPALSRLDHINPLASNSALVWNTEPPFLHQWSAAEGEQHLDDAQSNDWFLPIVMDDPTPSFTFSMPLTPHATRMSPPPRPGRDSPVAVPSSALIGHPDFPTPPNLFGLPHSPLPPSPSLGSGPSPGS
jgi:hypothetical protein